MKNNFWKTFLFTLAFFGAVYMLLVFSSRLSHELYSVVGWACGLLAAIALALAARKGRSRFMANMLGILSGLLLWAFIGEFMEVKYDLVIAASLYLPVLSILVVLLLVALFGKQLKGPAAFAVGHFLCIWGLHMWMIHQFEHLGRFHWSTYSSAAATFLLGIIAVYLGRRSGALNRRMALAVASLLLFWTVLEYVWGWRLLPGPYSIG